MGQLLTDEDLRRLDHYIVAKNRLHNRYLHGTGVVCGLEVVCNPCDPTVTVRTGFAIGPCGEDIVVCNDTAVDVTQLIRDQRRARRRRLRAVRRPAGRRLRSRAPEVDPRDLLRGAAVRGVTSLRQKEWTSCGCSCAKCGGNGNGNGHTTTTDVCSCRQHHSTPAQCEPTVTCEGYYFKLYKKPPETRKPAGLSDSELGQRVQACLQQLVLGLQQLPPQPSPAVLVEYCCQLKDELRDIIETANVHDCTLGMRVSDVLCPDVNDPDASAKALQSILLLLQIAIDLFRNCICSALLPPCPVDSPDDCVPLATLTVRTADLRVLEICNWDARAVRDHVPDARLLVRLAADLRHGARRDHPAVLRDAATAPLQHGRAAARHARRVRVPRRSRSPRPRAPAEAGPEAAAEPRRMSASSSRISRATATPLSGLEATVLASLGAQTPEGEPLAAPVELQDPFAALALDAARRGRRSIRRCPRR